MYAVRLSALDLFNNFIKLGASLVLVDQVVDTINGSAAIGTSTGLS